jgi:ATPase subunit of ABC transporter with duplicated ATPase domains
MSTWDACPVPIVEQSANCVVVISHDRWFLDRIATHILAFEGESKATFFDGNARGAEWALRRGLQVRRLDTSPAKARINVAKQTEIEHVGSVFGGGE